MSTRKARYPGQVARQNDTIHKRTFRGTSEVFLQQSDGDGVYASFELTFPIGQYRGSTFISQCFDQYRVRRVTLLMRPSARTLNGGSSPTTPLDTIKFQSSLYSLMNGTQVWSFIDYDTAVAASIEQCLQRPNLKMQSLQGSAWTMIAKFAPKTLSNQSGSGPAPNINFNSTTWLDTTNLAVNQYGVRGIIRNASPVFDTQDNVAKVEIMAIAEVEMRGPKNEFTTSIELASVAGPLGTRNVVADMLSPVDDTRL